MGIIHWIVVLRWSNIGHTQNDLNQYLINSLRFYLESASTNILVLKSTLNTAELFIGYIFFFLTYENQMILFLINL